MQTSLSKEELFRYLTDQIKHYFPDKSEHYNLRDVIAKALDKVEYCFSYVNLNHFYRQRSVFFNHLNSDQYTIFIYYASNIAYEVFEDEILASKLFYLNKVLNQFHCMYDTILPNIFLLIHTSGIILGKANYSDFLVVSHHCTVGANADLEYPKIGKFTIMYPYSSIVGNSTIGENNCISNGCYINDTNISSNKLIFGRDRELLIKDDQKCRISYFFKN